MGVMVGLCWSPEMIKSSVVSFWSMVWYLAALVCWRTFKCAARYVSVVELASKRIFSASVLRNW